MVDGPCPAPAPCNTASRRKPDRQRAPGTFEAPWSRSNSSPVTRKVNIRVRVRNHPGARARVV